MKKILIISVIVSIWYSLKDWFVCAKFADTHYFSSLDLQLRIFESIHADQNVPLFIVRMYHNKLFGAVLDIFHSYVWYLDIRLLMSLIGIAGLVFFAIGVYKIFQQKNSLFGISIILFVILYPLLEILLRDVIPFIVWLTGFGIFLSLVAGFGIYTTKQSAKLTGSIVILILLGIWWGSIYSPLALTFCKI